MRSITRIISGAAATACALAVLAPATTAVAAERVTATVAPVDVSPVRVGLAAINGLGTAYVRGADGALHWRYIEHTDRWKRVPGTIGSGPDALIGAGLGVELYARGANGGVVTNTQKKSGGFGRWKSLGGSVTSAPSAALMWNSPLKDNAVMVAARGKDGQAVFNVRSEGSWLGWKNAGGLFTSAIEVSVLEEEQAWVLTGRDTSGGVVTKKLWANSDVSTPWTAVANVRTTSAVALDALRPHLFYRTAKNTLASIYLPDGTPEDFRGALTSAPEVMHLRLGQWYVGARGTDNTLRVLHRTTDGDSWLNLGGVIS
jgi:hypothetical protein